MGTKLIRSEPMMANFMCELDGAMGYLAIWSNIILSVSVKMLLVEFNV